MTRFTSQPPASIVVSTYLITIFLTEKFLPLFLDHERCAASKFIQFQKLIIVASSFTSDAAVVKIGEAVIDTLATLDDMRSPASLVPKVISASRQCQCPQLHYLRPLNVVPYCTANEKRSY